VLVLDPQKVETDPRENIGHVGRGNRDPGADQRLALSDVLLKGVKLSSESVKLIDRDT